jgi:hypothetical protein
MAKETTYADTCVEQESGDVAGYVVTLSDAKAPTIGFNWSEGALKGPVPANVTDYDRASGRLAFSAQTEFGIFSFKGTIRAHAIDGIVSSPWEPPRHVELQERSVLNANEPKSQCPN